MYKSNLFPAVFLLIFVAGASPIDTAYDLFDAVEYQDGYALERIFAEDLYFTFTEFLDQTRVLAEADPVLAESILLGRYRGRITVEDLIMLSNEEMLGKILGEVYLQSREQIEQESANMEGREATVIITYFNGASVSFRMVWENSDWRITDTSLLTSFFN